MEDEEDTAHLHKPWWKTINAKSVPIFIFAVLAVLLVFKLIFTGGQEQKPDGSSQSTKPSPTIPVKTADWAEGQIIVKFKENVSDAKISARLKELNSSIKGKIEGINATIVAVPPGKEAEVMSALADDPIVKYAEPDYIQKVNWVPNDTYYKNQWGLVNTGQTIKNRAGKAGSDIKTQQAWDVTRGNGIKIAILDTGLDMSHPDLASKVVSQKAFTTSSASDRFGHGTHVAGIAAAITNNGQGVAGACPECQLMIGKVMGDDGTGMASAMSSGITWAADNGAKVINISGGGAQRSASQEEAVTYAWNKGVIVVAAAGNENTNQQFYPAALNNVLSVAASGNSDTRAGFSNYGTWVNVAAPGEGIYSTMPTTAYGMQSSASLALNYDYLSGTSMASPMVAGVAGLVWASSYGTSATNVVNRITSTADKITGTGQYWESGRVNAAKAVGAGTTPTTGPTTAPTSAPSGTNPTPSLVVPTFGCMGSPNNVCPTLPPTQPPGGGGIQPTTTVPTQPGGGQPQPTSVVPSEFPNNPDGGIGRGGRGSGGERQGLIRRFINFLLQLLEWFFRIIGRLGGSN